MFYRFSVSFLRLLVTIFNRYIVVGEDKIPQKGGAIVVCNHKYYQDPILVGCSCLRRRFYFVAKKELFRFFWFGLLIRSLGAFPVNRERVDRDTIRTCTQLLQKGNLVLIFAEGTRNKDPHVDILPLKTGFAFLANRAKVPVIPMYITKAENVFQYRIPKKKIYVHIGEPIPWNQPLRKLVQTTQNALYALCIEGKEEYHENQQ
ncbi:MAG: lysophospholipid acyltransferase family protein [Caldisericia bacterium]|nr:lysophospholipid acyltransferase family protein [Caldisericia bacterium]MDD4614243.1 lysophospholipid acyltransferase family protein [Caldisericia bacterium]